MSVYTVAMLQLLDALYMSSPVVYGMNLKNNPVTISVFMRLILLSVFHTSAAAYDGYFIELF